MRATLSVRDQDLESRILAVLQNRFNKVGELTPYEGELLKSNLLYVEPMNESNQIQIYCTPEHKRVAILYGTDKAWIF